MKRKLVTVFIYSYNFSYILNTNHLILISLPDNLTKDKAAVVNCRTMYFNLDWSQCIDQDTRQACMCYVNYK